MNARHERKLRFPAPPPNAATSPVGGPSRSAEGWRFARAAVRVALGATCLAALASAAFAAGWTSQEANVLISPIAVLSVSVGSVGLSIGAADPGSEPWAATAVPVQLAWTSNQGTKKITVQTSLASQAFSLWASMRGEPTGHVISTTPTELASNLAPGTGTVSFSLSATAAAASGTGTEVHTLLYTLTDQK